MNKVEFDNPMRKNVWDVPQLCIDQCKRIEKDSRLVLSTPEIFDITRIILTGCGDSYAAGLSMKPAIEELTGIPVEVIAAINFSRYTPSELLSRQRGSTLVIAVSNSGKVARVAEAMERAGKYGCLTVAVTGNMQSPLAKASQKTVGLEIPPFISGNGVRSYLVSMLALLIIAIRIGEVKGRYPMTHAEGYRKEICEYARAYQEVMPTLDRQMAKIANENQEKELFDFIGSGGNTGTAWFSQAKIIEATGEWAVYTDTEDWMHLNCFLKHLDRKFTMMYASYEGKDFSRSIEVINVITDMKCKLYVVTDSENLSTPETAEKILLPKCQRQWMWPLLNYLPVSLLAGYLCERKGETYGRGGRDNWAACGGLELLTDSKITIL